jgi:hypothetical protein
MFTSVAALLVFLPNNSIAQEKTLKQQIQGPWSLASCNSTDAKGEKAAYCANNPKGITILAGNGNFATTIVAGGRKDASAPGIIAQFGTWSVNEADKTLTMQRVGSANPATEGSTLKMNVSLNGEEMRLTGAGNTNNRVDVTLRRFKQ